MSESTRSALPLVCLADFETEAKKRLDRRAKEYYFSAAGNEDSLRENKAAFQRLLLRWRTMCGINTVDLSTTVQGQRLTFPVGIAPTAMQRMAHPDGEVAAARASARCGTIMTLSTLSTSSMEEVASAVGDGVRWLQLYIGSDRQDAARNLVERAERSGYSALVLTIDCPKSGKRHVEMRNPFSIPSHLAAANFDRAYCETFSSDSGGKLTLKEIGVMLGERLQWSDVDWLRSITKLPVIVKGVMTAEDAREAVQHKVDGVWVSNHGGREIDTTPATIEALPEVVAAVGDKVEVYLDGGVRCGTDVLKALALGCRAVFVGRPALWGLACDGEDGVSSVLEILREELSLALRISGCRNVREFPPNLVVHSARYRARL